MKSPKVRLYVRALLPDGTRPFLDPVFSANRKLKPGWAIVQGEPQRFDDATYYARYANGTKRVYERLGTDPQLASLELDKLEKKLAAIAAGAIAPETIALGSPATGDAIQRRLLLDAVRKYIDETNAHKSKKTAYAYAETCLLLLESLDGRSRNKPITLKDAETGEERSAKLADLLGQPSLLSTSVRQMHIEDIRREHVLAFATFLRKRGNEPRTISNRVKNVRTFLFHFDLPWVLKRGEIPKFTKKKVRAYKEHELDLMFSHATEDEADLLHFLMRTGAREQEAQYACWADVDLVAKEYRVTERRDLGFVPKDREEGAIPLSDFLVERLIARRAQHPKTRLIFPTADNKPNGHLLRIIKRLALRAGANCRECVNKRGLSCAEQPVCRQIILHKMRKTYATRLHRSGVPARTIQGWLRHSDLATTMLYLAEGEDDQQTRSQINAAFAQFSQIGGAA